MHKCTLFSMNWPVDCIIFLLLPCFLNCPLMETQEGFLDYLRLVDCSEVEVYAIPEGSVVFPKVPLIRVEGPVAVSESDKDSSLMSLSHFAMALL